MHNTIYIFPLNPPSASPSISHFSSLRINIRLFLSIIQLFLICIFINDVHWAHVNVSLNRQSFGQFFLLSFWPCVFVGTPPATDLLSHARSSITSTNLVQLNPLKLASSDTDQEQTD